MAQATTQPQVPSQPEISTPAPAPRPSSPIGSEASTITPESHITSENPDTNPLPGRLGPLGGWVDSWHKASTRIANYCGVLGLLLAVIFGATQWVAQDKSIEIAKESELITLALSCSDNEIKNTSICQQYLDKYPDGPIISRREVTSSNYLDAEEAGLVPSTLEDIAAHLAMMDRLLQKQNSRFQSTLDRSDPLLSLAHMEDIVKDVKFLQDIASAKTALARQRADDTNPHLTSSLMMAVKEFLTPISVVILIISGILALLVGFVLTQFADIELFLLLGFLVLAVDPVLLRITRIASFYLSKALETRSAAQLFLFLWILFFFLLRVCCYLMATAWSSILSQP